jgi:hypothetical protein
MKANEDHVNPLSFVPCHEAAAELRKIAGIFALAPFHQRLLAKLESCSNPNCLGTPLFILNGVMVETFMADKVLALQN